MKALLTNSRLKSARACQRLHKLEYVQLWRPATEADVLRFGTLFHRGLEAWWRAPSERAEAALEAVAGEADPFDRVRAEVLLAGYDARWGGEDYAVLSVEAEFRTPLRNPETGAPSRTWDLGGKLDVVARDNRDGRVLLVEHKTTTEDIAPGGEYWRRLRMDGQVSVYFTGANALGFDVAGCIYDVIHKPTIRPLKATPVEARKYTKPTKAEPVSRLYAGQREADETPEEFRARLVEEVAANPNAYFMRREVARLEAELEESLFDVWQVGRQIREAELAGRAPRNPDACVRYGRTCPFFAVCTGEESLEDNPRFVRSASHPELAVVSGETPKEETNAELRIAATAEVQ